eukprot:gb/GFBE01038804.1/.p1 GENE.gb/GFBE01038804.1/~~gb/GFBE01038804.1/.p1  ORF type:complete len:426 (+),score=134.06 gb/GFBE01038804.1/:1-1278(+)
MSSAPPMASAKATVEALAFSEAKKAFILNDLDPVLEAMVQDVLKSLPESPIDFMIEWLRKKHGGSGRDPQAQTTKTVLQINKELKKELESMQGFVQEVGEMVVGEVGAAEEEPEEDEEEEEEEDSDDEDWGPPPAPTKHGRHRASVSAEASGIWNQKKAFEPPRHPKTEEQSERLRAILQRSFLFSSLDESDFSVILLAMKEVTFEPGERIIQQGDDGDFLCLIEDGSPECKLLIEGEEKVVKTCTVGDVFGELALLYNAPRAASVDATDKCIAWQLDRETFNHIVKEAAVKRSTMYESILKKVSLFYSLSDYMRSQVADALQPETVRKGDFVLRQGEEGESFYLVEAGELVALKASDDGETAEVMKYAAGDYFGELAMLKDQPRAASIQVTSDTAKVLSLDRRSFKRLLGPLQELMLKKSADYS